MLCAYMIISEFDSLKNSSILIIKNYKRQRNKELVT